MEFLRKLFLQTAAHLRGLTVSQRLAIAACGALVVVALSWMVNWAGSPVMVPLLDQPMSQEEVTPIQQRLDAMGVKYTMSGQTMLVPAADEYHVRAQLAQSQVLPRDTSLGFTRLIEKNSSPWQDMSEKDWLRSIALGNELARTLCEFDGIEDAKVFIDKRAKRTIGQPPVVPTASVFVKPAAGVKLGEERVYAMAQMVAAAVGGLDPNKVRVADMTTGKSYAVPSDEQGRAFDDLEDRQKKEAYFARKIRDLFDIPGLLVAVHATLDEEASQVVKEEHGKPVLLTDETENENQVQARSAQEPGVNPNTSVAIAQPSSSESMEKNRSRSTFDGHVDRTVTRTEKPRHGILKLFASVNLPRSYLAAIFKASNAGKEPTDEQIDALAKTELDVKIKTQVMGVLGLAKGSEEQVNVAWIHDEGIVQSLPAVQAGQSENLTSLVRAYGGKAGLASLAFMSLMMMLMLVRRGHEGPVLPGEEPPAKLFRIRSKRKAGPEEIEMTVAEDVVGEAAVSGTVLIGREVDEQTLHTQEIVTQVQEMIKEDPDAAVSILRRWMDTDESPGI